MDAMPYVSKESDNASSMLGHASIKTTADRYSHISDTVLKRAARETMAAQTRVITESLVVPPGAEETFHALSTGTGTEIKIPNDLAGAGHGSRTRDLRLGKPMESKTKSAA